MKKSKWKIAGFLAVAVLLALTALGKDSQAAIAEQKVQQGSLIVAVELNDIQSAQAALELAPSLFLAQLDFPRNDLNMLGSGLPERVPDLAGIMRDIVILRIINRAELSPSQLEKALPVLRNLAKEQEKVVNHVREQLLNERGKLLKGNGPSSAIPGVLDARKRVYDYRSISVQAAKTDLAKILRPNQAEILGDLITPPEAPTLRGRPAIGPVPPLPMRGPAGKIRLGPNDTPEFGPASSPLAGRMPGRDHDKGMAQTRLIDLDRLIELLEEKLAAMKPAK